MRGCWEGCNEKRAWNVLNGELRGESLLFITDQFLVAFQVRFYISIVVVLITINYTALSTSGMLVHLMIITS